MFWFNFHFSVLLYLDRRATVIRVNSSVHSDNGFPRPQETTSCSECSPIFIPHTNVFCVKIMKMKKQKWVEDHSFKTSQYLFWNSGTTKIIETLAMTKIIGIAKQAHKAHKLVTVLGDSFVQIAKCACPYSNCLYPNCKIYLSKLWNVFALFAECIFPNS